MKIIFFGAGTFAQNIWSDITSKSEVYMDEYIAIADNNFQLCRSSFIGIPIIAPHNIDNYDFDFIVITSLNYENEIRNQLLEQLNISKEKVLTYLDYSRRCYASWMYRKSYGMFIQDKRDSLVELKKLIVYTAITGNYDTLKDPLFIADNITYVCFTNNRDIKSEIWNVEYVEDSSMDNMHLAKHFKMNPHQYFPDYEISIWIDGKYQILDDFRTYIRQYQKESGILCFPHPERQCICEELAACILCTTANNRDMINQVSDYLREGYPLNHGLYEGGCLVRLHNDAAVKGLMKRWEDEVYKYSVRDQLSFPFLCWKYGILPDICDLDINKNQWLIHTGHAIQ